MSDGLPDGLEAYKRTPVFDQDTLPAGLRRAHRTRPGVWALIHVIEGRLRFRILEPFEETELAPGKPGVVRPGQPHEVEPLGPVRMYVEFHAAP
ncbi:MAG: DUF1971 domain-containing protein [Alphaproteobacteria bacterium]|nr:DUF1971 domain-containing protein [Alphaproteobacteria bacterium]